MRVGAKMKTPFHRFLVQNTILPSDTGSSGKRGEKNVSHDFSPISKKGAKKNETPFSEHNQLWFLLSWKLTVKTFNNNHLNKQINKLSLVKA